MAAEKSPYNHVIYYMENLRFQGKIGNFPRGVDRLRLNSGIDVLVPSFPLRWIPLGSLFSCFPVDSSSIG